MKEPEKKGPWDGFQVVQPDKKPDSWISTVFVWAFFVAGGFVLGGLCGVFCIYGRHHRMMYSSRSTDVMLADSDEKATWRFLIGGVIGAVGVLVWLIRERAAMRS